MEIWKPIKGYEDSYEVSNLGRVRSKDKMRRIGNGVGHDRLYPSKILSTSINNCGYSITTLSKPGTKIVCKSIHRLVAEAFIPNPNNLPDINHKDENKLNNCVENLEWISHSDNLRYGTCQEKRAKSLRKTDIQKVSHKYANGWIPPIFRHKKRYAVIYNGVRYNSREEWSERVGKTRARLTQLERTGDAQIEVYYTVELNN